MQEEKNIEPLCNNLANNNSVIVKKYKIIFVGTVSLGKTSLLNRILNDTFESNYQPTIGIDFLMKKIYICGVTVK